MDQRSKREREERALDALLVSALRRVDKAEDAIEPDQLPKLTDEEKAAMKDLGGDFIRRVLAGERPLGLRVPHKDEDCPDADMAVAGSGSENSFNRADVVDDLTKEELARQEEEILKRRACRGNTRESGSH